MREHDALRDYPQPTERVVGSRGIHHRIVASYRGREFFDGERDYGYGGLVNDGRWKPVAKSLAKDYRLKGGSSVLQLNCEKGFLLEEFQELGIKVMGIEPSAYARRYCKVPVIPNWSVKDHFDLVLGIGAVYVESLANAIQCLKQIERIGFNAFITLASYETEEDLRLFKSWSLLATTVLKKSEWLEVMNHAGYTGDYWFVNAHTLRLREA